MVISATSAESLDWRKRQTRQALLGAFFALVLERRYHEIRIDAICTRAGVGRSTFYEHFANKDALLAASIEAPFATLADAPFGVSESKLTAILEHFYQNRALAPGIFTGLVRRKVSLVLVRMIEQRLKSQHRAYLKVPLRLAAIALAGAQLAPLIAWLAGECPSPPEVLARALKSAVEAMLMAFSSSSGPPLGEQSLRRRDFAYHRQTRPSESNDASMFWLMTQMWGGLLLALLVGATLAWLIVRQRTGPIRRWLADARAGLARQDAKIAGLGREQDDAKARIKRLEAELTQAKTTRLELEHAGRKQAQEIQEHQQRLAEAKGEVESLQQALAGAKLAHEVAVERRLEHSTASELSQLKSELQAQAELHLRERTAARAENEDLKAEIRLLNKQLGEQIERTQQALKAASLSEAQKAELARRLSELVAPAEIDANSSELSDQCAQLQQELDQLRLSERAAIEQARVAAATIAELERALVDLKAEYAALQATTAQSVLSKGKAAPVKSSDPYDLLLIKGIGEKLKLDLQALGVIDVRDIARWQASDIEPIAIKLGRFKGRIQKDAWVAQALDLVAKAAAEPHTG
jgi:predicted flap endonuclease-1-like 5' DNA nuclease